MTDKKTERFIALANIELFRRRLHDTTDQTTRTLLTRLLWDEEAKLAALQSPPAEDPQS